MRHPERRVNVTVLQNETRDGETGFPIDASPDHASPGHASLAHASLGHASLGDQPWTGPFPDRADVRDILYCFRLLLGRLPNREEWRGHTMRVGEPLEQVVGSYVGSLEFSRRGLAGPRPLGTASLARLPDFSIFTEADDAAVGRYVRDDDYEADVTTVFRAILRPGHHVLDLGANIGYFALLSAALVGPAGSVIAVEPNPSNARLLEASRRANGFNHVTVAQVAAGLGPGLLALHRSHSNGTTSAAPDEAAALLDAETVGCVRAETLVPRGRRIDLIKVDVEGAEYLALGGCSRLIRRDRPRIVTEFSPSLMPGISGISGPDYLRWLQGLGYRLSIVEPDGSLRPAESAAIMAEHERRGTDHLDLLAEPTRGRMGGRVRAAASWLRRRLPALAVGALLVSQVACAPRGCDNPYVLDYLDGTDRAADLNHVGLVRDAIATTPGVTPNGARCASWEKKRDPSGRVVLRAQYYSVLQISNGWKLDTLDP